MYPLPSLKFLYSLFSSFHIPNLSKMVLTKNNSEYDRSRELAEFDDTKAGVKGLSEAGVKKIPQIFVDEQFIQEKKTNNFSKRSEFSIPIIDMGCLNKDASGRERIMEQVKGACEEWGFFQIVNHGIPVSLLADVLDGIRKFHEQDVEVKKKYHSRDFKKKVLYNSNFDLYQAKTSNWRDSIYFIMAPDPPQPQEMPPVCRDAMMEYAKQVKKLGKLLFELLSEALGLKTNHLKDMDCGEGLFVSAHYYPACPEPDSTLGLSTHTDTGFLTLLLQDQIGGLQVLHKNQWVDVPPSPGALVVNIGDLMQLITNAKFKSVFHRVLANNVGPRISVGCFFRMHLEQNNNSKTYGPIKELLSEDNPPVYREAIGEEVISYRYTTALDGIPVLSHFELNATRADH
ncbi:hypothetical protein ACS0TY_022867 [Phlomoides rotata]